MRMNKEELMSWAAKNYEVSQNSEGTPAEALMAGWNNAMDVQDSLNGVISDEEFIRLSYSMFDNMGYSTDLLRDCQMKTDNINLVGVHVFEASGLGKPPYQFRGVNVNAYVACHGAPAQPGGVCGYCGHSIMYEYAIRSSDGVDSVVGCDCINKSGDANLIKLYKTHPDQRRLNRERAKSKDLKVSAELNKLMSDKGVRDMLASIPRKLWSSDPYTKLDAFELALRRCGAAGRKRYLDELKKLILDHALAQQA